MANVGKWYTFEEFYNEDGIQISRKEATKNYIKVKKTINIKIDGNTGTRTIWHQCQRNKQLKLF